MLRSLEELVDHEEQLLLVDLVVKALEELLHGTEVGLDLLLGVLVHAQLHLSALAAVHEALDLAQVAHGTVEVVGEDLVLQTSRQILSNLVAAVENLLVSLSKPGAWQLKRNS